MTHDRWGEVNLLSKLATNTRELVKSAYSRISMLSKLRYTGVSSTDLFEIYALFVRSRAEYMSVVWHSSLTLLEANKIKNIQKTSLSIIPGESYEDYLSSLAKTGLKSLSERRKYGAFHSPNVASRILKLNKCSR